MVGGPITLAAQPLSGLRNRAMDPQTHLRAPLWLASQSFSPFISPFYDLRWYLPVLIILLPDKVPYLAFCIAEEPQSFSIRLPPAPPSSSLVPSTLGSVLPSNQVGLPVSNYQVHLSYPRPALPYATTIASQERRENREKKSPAVTLDPKSDESPT